jgi:membrane-associated phospholipid phosphatase
MERTHGFIQSGIDGSNLVAAVPSLHGAGALLVAWFLWPLARRRWRPLLAAYPLAMAFSLVYGGDHYVVDILLGWALVACVMLTVGRFEHLRTTAHSPDAAEVVVLTDRTPSPAARHVSAG